MALLIQFVVTWMLMMTSLNIDIVKGKDDFKKNTKSVFSLEERNLLALGRIFETLEKLAEPQASCKKENETNEKLQSLISAVENTQNTVKIIAESSKNSMIDTTAKFETLLTAIQNTQDSVKMFAESTSDAITKLQQAVLEHIPASSQTVPTPPTANNEITDGATTLSPFTTVNSDLCASPYDLVGDECFHVSSNERDWDSAKLQCEREGGTLAAPSDLDLLRQHLRFIGEVADYWIGGHDKDGPWKWITGDPIEDEWGEDQPSGGSGADCLDFRAGRWPSLNDYDCDSGQRYICERSYTGTVPPTLEPVDCSTVGAINVGQKCLSVSEDELNWNDSAAACTQKGGQLASLQDKRVIFMVHDYILTNHGSTTFWLGGSDIANEGQWVWMDGQGFQQFPWRYPEPNNANDDEDCLEWGANAEHFNDAPCQTENHYICELDVSSINGTEPDTTVQDSATETTLDDDSLSSEATSSEI